MSYVRDGEDFTQFVHRCAHRLKKVAFLLTGSEHDAEDLLQTALAKLYLRWRRLDDGGDPIAYAHRVLVTTHTSIRRRRWWGERPTGELPERGQDPDPAGRVAAALVLREALQELTPRQRAVVVLRHYEDLDERRVAEILGCSVGTVKTLNSRALARLRQRLHADPEGNGPEPIVVVAAALDAGGRPRIGWFTASGTVFTATTALLRRAETPGPQTAGATYLAALADLPGERVAFALAAPGYTVAVPQFAGEDLPPGVRDPEGELVQRVVTGPTAVYVMRGGQFVANHDLG